MGYQKIRVYHDDLFEGTYSLVDEPFCRKCAHPGVTTDECTDHGHLESIERIYAMGWYYRVRDREEDDLLSKHILQAKKNSSISEPLGRAMAITARRKYPELLKSNLIIPIPLHPKKLKERGHNQALELARIVSNQLNIELLDGLEKTRNVSFRNKSWEERLELIDGLYKVKAEYVDYVRDKKIIILDDVTTTGLTLNECTKVLFESDTSSVNAFTATKARRI
ncbi:MAG: hypothetical protein QCH99_03680 [Candidatus Bathyarchaeota archaeon]|nr:hypothetical protein [Candidatus Bathyarchaeum tardum]